MEGEFDLERTVDELRAGIAPEENSRLLFRQLWPSLDRFFARCGIARDERADLAQETLLRIYSTIGSFRREARFATWVFTIATNVYRKHRRGRSAGKRTAEVLSFDGTDSETGTPLSERLVDESTARPDPEQSLLGTERTRNLLEAVEALPHRMRKCLILKTFQDLTYEEIGVVMRLSPETVRSHLFHARRRLRERLADPMGHTADGSGSAHG